MGIKMPSPILSFTHLTTLVLLWKLINFHVKIKIYEALTFAMLLRLASIRIQYLMTFHIISEQELFVD